MREGIEAALAWSRPNEAVGPGVEGQASDFCSLLELGRLLNWRVACADVNTEVFQVWGSRGGLSTFEFKFPFRCSSSGSLISSS